MWYVYVVFTRCGVWALEHVDSVVEALRLPSYGSWV